MSAGDEAERIVVDGLAFSISRVADEQFEVRVETGSEDQLVGTLTLVAGGSGFIARRPDGAPITRPSPWGGDVTARFQSRELAVRALLASSDESRA